MSNTCDTGPLKNARARAIQHVKPLGRLQGAMVNFPATDADEQEANRLIAAQKEALRAAARRIAGVRYEPDLR